MACPWCQKLVDVPLCAESSADPELPGHYNQRMFGPYGPFLRMPEGFRTPRICSCGTVYCPLAESTQGAARPTPARDGLPARERSEGGEPVGVAGAEVDEIR